MAARFDREALLSPSLASAARGRRARALDALEAAIDAVEPARATTEALRPLGLEGAVSVLAFGKAAEPMVRAALGSIEVRGGLAVTLAPAALGSIAVRVGAHPDPARDACETGRAALAFARSLGSSDTALCLVSGGGSAMLELPREGITLEQLSDAIFRLARAGADIAELNAVRRALSQLKGGGLARALAPARIVNVVISDVPGLPPEVVASGPTCPTPMGPRPDEVMRRYGLLDALAPAVRAALARAPETFDGVVETCVAADNKRARRATGLPDRGLLLSGEARELGARLAGETLDAPYVAGGETTVTVRGSGRGGRSLELALGALASGWDHGLLLAAGTDGVDGNSGLAGALLDGAVVREARRQGLDPARFLANNDAGSFFEAAGGALRCGPTGTNVADLCLALR